MASKTLIRTGSFLVNRLLNKPFVPLAQKTHSNSPISTHGLDITPKVFPSLSNFYSPLHLQQNDAESIRNVYNEGFLYPSGLPSLEFFLPDGDDSLSKEPMLLFPKRTFQPSTIRRKRKHGFFSREIDAHMTVLAYDCMFYTCIAYQLIKLAIGVTFKATKGGRRVIARRIAKGRARITA
ncbi:hypothetical protein F8388_023885 [Cannabis sativa]|uniref:Uncharacterized protein n=1 Tax=Cannabis sativa TaxID=3483 RepID=A0A7J6EUD3_CANSA|nr:hypothetical protein F8388_023885 [Cannabis sativa]KAF4399288.1 hypothetical protein G4B88_022371 [Cannabis sativa]